LIDLGIFCMLWNWAWNWGTNVQVKCSETKPKSLPPNWHSHIRSILYDFCPTNFRYMPLLGGNIACVCARSLHLMDGWVKDEKKLW
jgi:hypothetical protein